MLIDEVETLTLVGGHGGAGRVSFNPGKKGGPSGGDGGRGGDVYIQVTSDLTALNQFSKKKYFSAPNGEGGGDNKKSGKDGADLILLLPIGTSLTDQDSQEEIEVVDLNQRTLVCKGGLGGRGNFALKSPRRTTPMFAQPGLPGYIRRFHVNLKLIADYGLIGLPNAGKSSLLNELTKAKVKVANYPFTTLEPNLGVLGRSILADIPGLIEGASNGKGLGISFLKHIERVKVLLHCVAADSDDVVRDYLGVKGELMLYNQELGRKKELILLTKSDLVSKDVLRAKAGLLKKRGVKILPVSIHDWDSLEKLKKILL